LQIESKIGNGTDFITVVPMKLAEEEKIDAMRTQAFGNFKGTLI
jgi:hypothetical protein